MAEKDFVFLCALFFIDFQFGITIYSVGHIRPPAIIAQIYPRPGSRFSSYQDIIRLDNTGIMGLSSTPGLANYNGHEFQRDFAVEFGVLGFVDHTHAALTEFFKDSVMRNSLPDHHKQEI